MNYLKKSFLKVVLLYAAQRDENTTDRGLFVALCCVELSTLPDIVMALDVDFVKNPFWGLQEILFHLHSYVPGQQTH